MKTDPDNPSTSDTESQQPVNDEAAAQEKKKSSKRIHRLSLTQTEDFNEKLSKRGVVYVARIPPRMTPTKIKTLLSEFGDVTRVYLVEEDPTVRKQRRKQYGSSGGKRYLEGWVEFASKQVAKHVAASLNTTPISNHKRNPHYGDLWNLKYLSKFKWSHLTEKVAYERRVREQKLRVEMMQARKENAEFAQLVETGKKLDKIEARKRKRLEKDGKHTQDVEVGTKRPIRHQTKPLHDGTDKASKKTLLGSLV